MNQFRINSEIGRSNILKVDPWKWNGFWSPFNSHCASINILIRFTLITARTFVVIKFTYLYHKHLCTLFTL